MAWVELAVFGLILLLVAWVFLRPFPHDNEESNTADTDDAVQSASSSDQANIEQKDIDQ